MFGMFFFASLYVQEILGYSPLRAGLAFLPVSAGIIVGAGLAQQLDQAPRRAPGLDRRDQPGHGGDARPHPAPGPRQLRRRPARRAAADEHRHGADLRAHHPAGHQWGQREDSGLASGLFNTAQQVGGSLGLAILASLAASRTSSLLHGAGAAGQLAARVSGYHVAFLAAAIMLAAGAVLMTFALRKAHTREIERELAAGEVVPVPA